METLYGVLVDISKVLVRGAANQLHYSFCFNDFVKELEKEEGNLAVIRRGVDDRVAYDKKQSIVTAEVIGKWLKDANIETEKVNHLLKEARDKKSCCFGYCPNWIWRYRSGKKLANKKRDLEKIIQEGKPYVQLERIASLPSNTLDILSEKRMNFDSRKFAYEQLMEALKNDGVAMIGLYGMGGCGKTTLAMEARKIAEAEHIFDKVLFVPVSSTIEVRKIQEKIASSIQFTFLENEELERAQRLCITLTKENKILIILDDVWEKLDFGRIGIPSSEHHKGCKILITTRSKEVCISMDCQRKIYLPILTDEEAWTLFQNKALISEGTPETFKDLARLISDECKGLPVAIAAVASSLKLKDEVIWRVALNKLKNSKPIAIDKGLKDPYKCLKLSYDNLDNEEAKSLFLLCSVFPEDYEIPIELLIRCAIGLGVVREVRSYEDARYEVNATKYKLISSCLLLEADHGFVKVHDLVRDVAHLVAKNENKIIKCEPEEDVTLEQNSIRYLWCVKFPDDMDCSNLEFLCIKTKLEVSDGTFERMKKLRVLIITNIAIDEAQLSTMSFKTLTNLRCLVLQYWKLSDISFVRDMKKLQCLSLHSCSLPSFFELQTNTAVTQLTNLKLLEFNKCQIERKNFEGIKSIPLLEELYIIDINWANDNEGMVEFFNTFSVPRTLKRYGIVLGSEYFSDYDEKEVWSDSRTLSLCNFPMSNEVVKDLAKKAKNLFVEDIQRGAKNIIPDIFEIEWGGMNELNKLELRNSKEIKYLVDTSNHLGKVENFFSKLHQMRIEKMEHLITLWHGSLLGNGSFEKLEKLYLDTCPQLTSLFTYVIARCLVQLKILHIVDCRRLKDVVTDDDKTKRSEDEFSMGHSKQSLIFQNLQEVEIKECGELKHVFSAGSFTLSSLAVLDIRGCPMLDSLFTASVAKTLTSLEKLTIVYCHGLKHIVTQARVEENQKENIAEDDHDFQTHLSMFRSLKSLWIIWCDLLQDIFPVSFVGGMVKLNDTRNKNTSNLKDSLSQNNFEDNSCHQQQKNTQIELPALEDLILGDIKSIIIPDSYYVRCPSLAKLYLGIGRYVGFSTLNCSSNASEARHSDYIAIKISNSDSLHLVESDQYLSKKTQGLNLLIMRNIREIQLTGFDKTKYLFNLSIASLFMVEILKIRKCPGLEHIIDTNDQYDSKNWDAIFPNLKCLSVFECDQLQYIFCLNGHQMIGQVSLKLEDLELLDLPQMTDIWVATKNSFTLQHLKSLSIKGCAKLEVIFSRSVLRCLPELCILKVRECKELRQIIEEDLEEKKLSNLLSPQPCFPKLALLVVEQCHRLKHFASASESNDLPNLEFLVINGATELKEFIGCDQGKFDEIEKIKVDLPKLKLLIFLQLSNLRQETKFSNVKHRVVRNCPKLSLTSTTTLEELWEEFPYEDFEKSRFSYSDIWEIIHRMKYPEEVSTSSSTSELPSSQINEKTDKELTGKDLDSKELATATSTNSELHEKSSPSPLDICDRETHSQELVDGKSTSGPYLTHQQKPLGETEGTTRISQEWDPTPKKTSPLQMNQEDPSTSESKPCSSQVNDNNQSMLGSIAEIVREHKKIESRTLGCETEQFNKMERESERTSDLQSLEQKLSLISSPKMAELVNEESNNEAGLPYHHALRETMNLEEIGRESIEEEPPLEGAAVKTLPIVSGVATHKSSDGDILAQDSQVVEQDKLNEGKTGIAACKNIKIQEGANLLDKTKGIGIISNNSIEVTPASADTHSRLGEYKHFVDLDDAQISLLAEAIAAYPHLWNACEKFSKRFRAWMLKTLADMLFFLRNESVVSVNPQRIKEFHRLCDEAVQLGFESSWVDEMRQRVVAGDPKLERAKARIVALLKRHDHLTQELRNIKKELRSLDDFVDAQRKYFDFL